MFYTDLINQMGLDDKDRLSIFDKNGPYLATKKVEKNNPKAAEIKADNEIRMEWNRTVDHAIVSGVSEKETPKVTEIMSMQKMNQWFSRKRKRYHFPSIRIGKRIRRVKQNCRSQSLLHLQVNIPA